MSGTKTRSGGKRSGAGRLPQVFHLSKEAARSLYIVTGHRRGFNPRLTELEVLEDLIDRAWKDLNELYEQSAQVALEGEEGYLNATKKA